MTTATSRLDELIVMYLAGNLSLPEFWERFTFEWADSDLSELSPPDELFFSQVADRLHHVDYRSPSEPGLEDPDEFRSWLATSASERDGT